MNTDRKKLVKKNYHAARWQEPCIFEQGNPGVRGYYPPALEEGIRSHVGNASAVIPENMLRKTPPALPEVTETLVTRHWTRLSQMTMGYDVTPDGSQGDCTMKYSPKLYYDLLNSHKMADLHPLQDESTVQGILQIMWQFGEYARSISGMDAVSFQPSSGAHGIFTNSSLIRAYHESKGQLGEKDEIISTILSHPADAATPHTNDFKIILIYPNEYGWSDFDAIKAAIGPRTAGLMITNPEDTGVYNPKIKEITEMVHAVDGICAYDQANLNGIMGVARAREAGFDTCQYNLHKTFATPHAGMGPGSGAVMCTDRLAKFLPTPLIVNEGGKFRLDFDRPDSIGKVRGFYGNPQVVLRAYAWTMWMGWDGLLLASQTAVINSNYLGKMLTQNVRGISLPWRESRRLEQNRYSWETLAKETGVTTDDVNHMINDYGLQTYWSSHPPRVVPEPMTLEPAESLDIDDLEEYVAVMEDISRRSYENPEEMKKGPYKSSVDFHDENLFESFDCPTTWRQWKKTKGSFAIRAPWKEESEAPKEAPALVK